MAQSPSFSAVAVFAVAIALLSSIVSAQDFEASPPLAPSPSLEKGFAVANIAGASTLLFCASLVFAFINNN